MKILVTNCNTSVALTKEIEAGARAAASPGTEILARTPSWGPESAEGWLDSFLSAAAVLDLLHTTDEEFDAVVLAGFGEHGREGARELLDVPVVDITEAAAHLACLLGRRYGVLTTLDRTCGLIEDSLRSAGVDRNCVAVTGCGLSVLELADERHATDALLTAARRLRDGGADVLVLGCAGMTGLDHDIATALGIPVIDGVAAAVQVAESLVRLGLTTSRNAYPTPLPKDRRWHP